MKFKVGDLVYIKPEAETILIQDPIYFDPKMKLFVGGMYEIEACLNEDFPRYHLVDVVDTDGYKWYWAEEWLEFADDHMNEIDDKNIDELLKEFV